MHACRCRGHVWCAAAALLCLPCVALPAQLPPRAAPRCCCRCRARQSWPPARLSAEGVALFHLAAAPDGGLFRDVAVKFFVPNRPLPFHALSQVGREAAASPGLVQQAALPCRNTCHEHSRTLHAAGRHPADQQGRPARRRTHGRACRRQQPLAAPRAEPGCRSGHRGRRPRRRVALGPVCKHVGARALQRGAAAVC